MNKNAYIYIWVLVFIIIISTFFILNFNDTENNIENDVKNKELINLLEDKKENTQITSNELLDENIYNEEKRLKLLEKETPIESYTRLKEIDKKVVLSTIEKNIIHYKELLDYHKLSNLQPQERYMIYSYWFSNELLNKENRKKIKKVEWSTYAEIVVRSENERFMRTSFKLKNVEILKHLAQNAQTLRHYKWIDSEKLSKYIKVYFLSEDNKKFYIENYDNIVFEIDSENYLTLFIKWTWKELPISNNFLSKMKKFIKIEIDWIIDDYWVPIKKTYTLPLRIIYESEEDYIKKMSHN